MIREELWLPLFWGAGLVCVNFMLYRTAMQERWFWQVKGLFGEKINRRDLLLAGGTVLLAGYGAWVFGGGSLQYPGFMLLSNLLLLTARTDLEERVIPDRILVAYLLLTALYHLYIMDVSFSLNRLLGSISVGSILGLAYLLKRDSIGLGDLKLLMLCGLLSGFPGVLSFLVRSLVFSAVFSLVCLLRKRAGLKSEVPFAPFLLLGAIL